MTLKTLSVHLLIKDKDNLARLLGIFEVTCFVPRESRRYLVHQALGFFLPNISCQIFGRENPNTLTYLNFPIKEMSEIDAKAEAKPTQKRH